MTTLRTVVSSVAKSLFRRNLAFGEEVHQRRLAHVGVAYEGHAGEFAAVFALHGFLFVDGE